MQLIFNRRASHRTVGRFRTHTPTEGVVPSLHVEYKKQALRTETTINDTYDFAIGRALPNLPALREIGFAQPTLVTATGAQIAMFYAPLYTRALRPACSLRASQSAPCPAPFDRLDAALTSFMEEVKLAA